MEADRRCFRSSVSAARASVRVGELCRRPELGWSGETGEGGCNVFVSTFGFLAIPIEAGVVFDFDGDETSSGSRGNEWRLVKDGQGDRCLDARAGFGSMTESGRESLQ